MTEGVYRTRRGDSWVAYITLETIRQMRDDWVERNTPLHEVDSHVNEPIRQLRRWKRKLLEPVEAHKDAYLLALMIGLMQLADDKMNGKETEVIPSRVHVIVLPNIRARKLYLYSARFPGCLTARFRWPNEMSLWDREHIAYASARLDEGLESCVANIDRLFTCHEF